MPDYSICVNNTLTNAVGCDSVITLDLTINTNSIAEVLKASIALYPSPTSGLVNIQSSLNINSIKVIDFAGRVVQLENKSNTIDLSSYDSGVYFIEINTNEGPIIERVMKF